MIPVEVLKQRSIRSMGRVKSQVKRNALQLIERSYRAGVCVQISSGFRTWEEQAALYGQGRPGYTWKGKRFGRNGKIVTNAEPGESVHNEGRAIDFFVVSPDGKKAIWKVDEQWLKVVRIAKELGFIWGGDWTSFPDYPHLEWKGRPMPAVVKRGDRGRLVKEVQLRLVKAGYSMGGFGVDGHFGPFTEAAVKKFQKDQRIEVDGIVGPVTWKHLR